jgi:hypothetical protein
MTWYYDKTFHAYIYPIIQRKFSVFVLALTLKKDEKKLAKGILNKATAEQVDVYDESQIEKMENAEFIPNSESQHGLISQLFETLEGILQLYYKK